MDYLISAIFLGESEKIGEKLRRILPIKLTVRWGNGMGIVHFLVSSGCLFCGGGV